MVEYSAEGEMCEKRGERSDREVEVVSKREVGERGWEGIHWLIESYAEGQMGEGGWQESAD